MNPGYLIILSFIGFMISLYLYYSKTRNKKIVCFSKNDCEGVVRSKYGKTFGIENTIGGMVYYGLVFAYALPALLNRNLFKHPIIYYLLVAISLGSVLFSAYLTAVQALKLKKWCDYCIISAMISLLIFLGVVL